MAENKQQEQPPALRLASASPRRRQLLELIGVPHVVTPADIDETVLTNESARDYVVRLARQKALKIWQAGDDLPVLGADTTVHVDGEILAKPESEADAIEMLEKLSARRHEVLTGVCVAGVAGVTVKCSRSDVTFRAISRDEMRAYWASGEPAGKAGAYAIQGLGAVFVADLSGSYTGVMGLPLFETAELLQLHGVAVWHGALRGVSGGY